MQLSRREKKISSFQTQTFVNILAAVNAVFSLTVASTWLEADWKRTTFLKHNAGGQHRRGEKAASEFTCVCWQSCAQTTLPAQQPWPGGGGYFTIQADTAMPTNPQSPTLASSYFRSSKQAKRKGKKNGIEGCCLTPCENITRDDGGSCAVSPNLCYIQYFYWGSDGLSERKQWNNP